MDFPVQNPRRNKTRPPQNVFNILGTAGGDQKSAAIKVDTQQNLYNILQGFMLLFSGYSNHYQFCRYTSAECLHLNNILVKLV